MFLSLWRRANAGAVSFTNSLRCPIYAINSVDNTKLPSYTLPATQYPASLETYPLYSYVALKYLFSIHHCFNTEIHTRNLKRFFKLKLCRTSLAFWFFLAHCLSFLCFFLFFRYFSSFFLLLRPYLRTSELFDLISKRLRGSEWDSVLQTVFPSWFNTTQFVQRGPSLAEPKTMQRNWRSALSPVPKPGGEGTFYKTGSNELGNVPSS